MTTSTTGEGVTLGRFCPACRAIPHAGQCNLKGCPMTTPEAMSAEGLLREVSALFGKAAWLFDGLDDEMAKANERMAVKIDAFLSRPTPATGEGWRVVPVEPTRAMWAAMGDALVGYKQRHHDRVASQLWNAVLAVAPPQDSDHG